MQRNWCRSHKSAHSQQVSGGRILGLHLVQCNGDYRGQRRRIASGRPLGEGISGVLPYLVDIVRSGHPCLGHESRRLGDCQGQVPDNLRDGGRIPGGHIRQ